MAVMSSHSNSCLPPSPSPQTVCFSVFVFFFSLFFPVFLPTSNLFVSLTRSPLVLPSTRELGICRLAPPPLLSLGRLLIHAENEWF